MTTFEFHIQTLNINIKINGTTVATRATHQEVARDESPVVEDVAMDQAADELSAMRHMSNALKSLHRPDE